MSNPILALIPSGYKTSKVYSILPNDASGDFTFSRSSYGTRVRQDGLIEEVVNNVPRLDWSSENCPILLLEAESTNYATNNKNMAGYSNVGGSNPLPTKTSNYAVAPDGTFTASRFQTSVTGTNYSLIQIPTTASDGSGGGYYTVSFYAKSNTGSSQVIAFYGQSSGTTTRTVTTEWTRLQFTGFRLANTKYAYIGAISSSDSDLDFLMWGAQLELVNADPSSLIFTSGSPTTRTIDDCSVTVPSGVTTITETFEDNTTNVISVIPATYTISEGRIKKIIME